MKQSKQLIKIKKRFQKSVLASCMLGAAFTTGQLHAQTPSYCGSAPTSDFGTDIFSVTFANMTNASNCSATAGPNSIRGSQGCQYSDYTSPFLPAINITTGVNYPLSVTVGDCAGNTNFGFVGVWIDWNQDGLFTGAGEQVYQSANTAWNPAGTAMNVFGGIYVPNNALPGTTRMRVVASEYNNVGPCFQNNYNYFEGETEDYTINVTLASGCVTTPGISAVVAPTTSVCAGSAVFLTTNPSDLNSSVTYTWQSSNSSVGPFTNLTNGSLSTYTFNAGSANTYYRLASQCLNGGGTVAATPALLMVAPTVTNAVPYFEGFEEPQILQDMGPNCSWNISTPGFCQYGNTADFNNITPYNGNGMAFWGSGQFNYTPLTSYYFWSNGIQLNTGVTYSASTFYAGFGYAFSLSYGSSQSPNGLTLIATNPNANTNNYKQLADTFRVPTSGIYYIAISAATQFTDEWLAFDDLSITAPCNFANNAANTVLTGTTEVCYGKSVVLTATGANSYTWQPGGATTNTIAVSPNNSTGYSVSGSKNTSNCVLTQTTIVNVEPVPGIQILPSVSALCVGQTATLIAIGSGATSFTWSTGDSGPAAFTTTISPTQTTTYDLVGINSYGCTTSVSQQITVNQPPTISIGGNTNICVGEPGTLLASGANTYTWSSSASYLQTNPISPYPTIIGTTSYTVTGIDANGCSGFTTVDLTVNVCTGIQTNAAGITNLQVYPNPTNGIFTIELNNGLSKTIDVMDVTGRVIMNNNTENDKMDVNINNLANGIYYVRVKSDNAAEVLKIVKQ